MKTYKFHIWMTAVMLLLLGSVSLPILGATTPQTLSIGNYVLVSKTKIGRFHYELSYSAELNNRGSTAVGGATAELKNFPPILKILIVDGQLKFGAVGPSQALSSLDTFTLRWPIDRPISSRILDSLLHWTITANQNPQITSLPVTVAQVQVPYSYQVIADDPDPGDVLEYSLSSAPAADIRIDPDTGLIQWLPTVAGEDYSVTIIVSDGKGGTATQSYTVAVAANLVVVPSVAGLTLAEAGAVLQVAQLGLGSATEKLSILVQTGRVAGQVPPAGAEVNSGTLVDLVLAMLPPADPAELMPAEWMGTWRLTTTYRDAATDALDSVAEITNAICTDDPIGLALVEQVVGADPNTSQTVCSGNASANRSEVSCSSRISVNTCTLDVTTQFSMVLTEDTITGTGAWAVVTNPCGLPVPSSGQTFLISGTRLDADAGGLCAAPASSLLQKFLRNPLTVYLGVTL